MDSSLIARAVALGLELAPCGACGGHSAGCPCPACWCERCRGTGRDTSPSGVLMAVAVAVQVPEDGMDQALWVGPDGAETFNGTAWRGALHDGTAEGIATAALTAWLAAREGSAT